MRLCKDEVKCIICGYVTPSDCFEFSLIATISKHNNNYLKSSKNLKLISYLLCMVVTKLLSPCIDFTLWRALHSTKFIIEAL